MITHPASIITRNQYTIMSMKIRTIPLNIDKLNAIFDNLLSVRLSLIRESMENGAYPEAYLNGPGEDIQMDIWDEVFKKAAREALASTGHGVLPAYTDDTVELLTRDGSGKVVKSQPFFCTDVRLENGQYRIYKDSYELGDGAIQLLDPEGLGSSVTGLEEDELAGFLLAFDALVPSLRKKMEDWEAKVMDAAKEALALRKADQIAQTAADELLHKHLGPLGLGWDCSVNRGMVDLAIYNLEDEEFFEVPIGGLPAFLQDRGAFSALLKGSCAQA